MTPSLGIVQRVVVLNLADGRSRSASRIDQDQLLDSGRSAGALRGLWKRGLVEREFSMGRIEWHLTPAGQSLADELVDED